MIEAGTESIGADAAKQQKSYLGFVMTYEKRTIVCLKLPNGWTAKSLPGRSKQSSNTRTNGNERGVKDRMETHVARGFLMLSLSNEQKQKVRKYEMDLQKQMAGRYLLPFEIMGFLRIPSPGNPTIEEINQLEYYFKEAFKDTHGFEGTDFVEKLWAFTDYLDKHYVPPLAGPQKVGFGAFEG